MERILLFKTRNRPASGPVAKKYSSGKSADMVLAEIITGKIKAEGSITFRDFMDMCLYYPGLGYYTSGQTRIGRDGDFFTSCNLTASFGAIIAKQMEEIWHILGEGDFTVAEYGAGQALLCCDILGYLKNNNSLFDRLRYCIIEKKPVNREVVRHFDGKVSWYGSIQDIPGDIDCVFSNELVDNFPVHQVVMEDALMESYVGYDDGFVEVLRPAPTELKSYFGELGVVLPKGYRTEVNLEALDWLKDVAVHLKKGFVITIDYGGLSEELYRPHKCCGTIVCYNGHQVSGQPFCNVGRQDITADVNFSALEHWGAREGLNISGFVTQASFLLSLGFREHLRLCNEQRGGNIQQIAKEEAFITYTLLFGMGARYKVLVQSKGLPANALTGLRLS